jgi:hypothetical protein
MAALTHCFFHPERPALAICVSCRRPVCQSCSTLWEGMHHCATCLAQRRAAVVERGTALRTAALGLLTLALLAGIAFLRAWLAAALMGLH